MIPSSSSHLLTILRSGLLLALTTWLAVLLISQVQAQHRPPETTTALSAEEPGLRVLLRNRERNEDHHSLISVFVHQNAVLYHNDGQETHWQAIERGSTLTIQPHLDQGFLISSRALPRDLSWRGGHLRLIADRHNHLDQFHADPAAPEQTPTDVFAQLSKIQTLEANNGRPVFSLQQRRYRGSLELHWTNARALTAVNSLPIEAYLEGVLQSELNASWPLQVLKAQAVASRSFAYARVYEGGRRPNQPLFHLRDSVRDQEYRGSGNGGVKIDWAITSTRGQVLTHKGVPFAPYYHAASGGQLASVAQVFPGSTAADGETPLDTVMVNQADPFCWEGVQLLLKEETHWRREVQISSGDLRNLLRDRDIRAGWPVYIGAQRDASGRVLAVTIGWASGDITMPASEFRQLLGPNRLRSTLWTSDSPSQDDGHFIIHSLGWGHGVGMSQLSAYAMAQEHDYDYHAILNYFYKHVELHRLWH